MKTIKELTEELCQLKSKESNYKLKSEMILNAIKERVIAEKNVIPMTSEIAYMTEQQIMDSL